MESVVLAEKPRRELASRCSVVRSYRPGELWLLGLASSVTCAGWPRDACAMACASASFQRRSARSSASSAFFFHPGSNHLPSYSPVCAAKLALISQYSREMCFLIFSSR